MIENHEIQDTDVAVIGISGRFPGANNIEEFWDNLLKGKETLTHLSKEEMMNDGVPAYLINNENYINVAGIMPDYDKFDNEFFEYSSRDALLMDPQYRVFLEESWKAFENAGYDPLSIELCTGVFVGGKPSNYLTLYQNETGENLSPFEWGLYAEISQLATRVSFNLNLKGPSAYVLTACSTSLVVVHAACQSLLNGECDMALAGAITIQSPHKAGYLHKQGLIFSEDGHCRSFDENASGTILSNGVGVIIIKRLSDAIEAGDRIEAIIKGTAINNDGSRKIGFTAPSVNGQAEVIASAINVANINPESIGYIEAHGTGTKIGDPIEIEGLIKAFRHFTNKIGFCKIGSVKSNIGHLDVASGMAGLIKTIFCLKNNLIPATLHFNQLNSNINLNETPFQINDTLYKWESQISKLRAGVSSFGFGGTNAHVILEAADKILPQIQIKKTSLICMSAKNVVSLKQMLKHLNHYLKTNSAIAIEDIAYTLGVGRHSFSIRKAITCHSVSELQVSLKNIDHIENAKIYNKIIFLFPGQGVQYNGMAHDLYLKYKIFKNVVDECKELIYDIAKFDILAIIFVNDGSESTMQLKSTQYAQLALFVIEYSLSKFLQSMNIIPNLMLGHSLGEYTAACIAGVLSLEDTIKLIYTRSILMQNTQSGKMVAVFGGVEIIQQKLLNSKLSIAAVNGKNLCVVSGITEEVELFKNNSRNIFKCVDLNTSHAFHSITMEPILTTFRNKCCEIQLDLAKIPYISNLTGKIINIGESIPQDYWSQHLRNTVQFYEGLQSIDNYKDYLFIEVGPGSTLSSMIKQIYPTADIVNLLPIAKKIENTDDNFNCALGKIWELGINIKFSALHFGYTLNKLSLPGYHFMSRVFWPTKPINVIAPSHHTNYHQKNEDHHSVRDKLLNIWKEYFLIIDEHKSQDFFQMGGDSLSAVYLIEKINIIFKLNLPVTWIYENSNFDKQCLALEKSNLEKNNNRIITFRDNKIGIPLFLLHPSRSGAEVYQEISKRLVINGPIYGINSYFLNYNDYSITSIEELAKIYITYIKLIKPNGPYFLGGWSMGGIVAYEIANQMAKLGEQILSVYMFDSAATDSKHKHLFINSISILQKSVQSDKQFIHFPDKLQKIILKQIEIDNLLLANYNSYEDCGYPVVLYKASNILTADKASGLSVNEIKEYNHFFSLLFSDKTNFWNRYIHNLKTIHVDACHDTIIKAPYFDDIVAHMVDDMNKKEQCIYYNIQ